MDELYNLFRNPPSECKPFVRGWWNGDCIEVDELRRELDIMKAAGIRGVEIGGVMFGRQDTDSGQWSWPELELVRLAIPRRVYTNTHLAYAAEIIERLWQQRESICGLRMVYSPSVLRHFTARFERFDD